MYSTRTLTSTRPVPSLSHSPNRREKIRASSAESWPPPPEWEGVAWPPTRIVRTSCGEMSAYFFIFGQCGQYIVIHHWCCYCYCFFLLSVSVLKMNDPNHSSQPHTEMNALIINNTSYLCRIPSVYQWIDMGVKLQSALQLICLQCLINIHSNYIQCLIITLADHASHV